MLLLAATWYEGAFALRHWAPVGVLALVIVAAAGASGALWVPERAARVALAGLWALAAWTLLSGLWADSAGRALEGAGRTALYAALFTVPCALVARGRSAASAGALIVGGLTLIAGVTVVELLSEPRALFLAGRLDDPVGYRNATACLFALAFWPLAAASARHGVSPPLRAAALAGAALVLALAFLTQARGVLLGLALGGVIAIGLGPDRLRRAWAALVVTGGLALASDRLLTPYRAFTDRGDAAEADITPAVEGLLLLVAGAFVVGLIGALLDGGLRLDSATRENLRRALALTLVVVTIGAVGGAIAAVGNPATFVSDRFDEFRSLETSAPGESRLAFGGGQRADLWRVALLEFGERPLTGVGEGSYQFRYYEERRTDRNLSTPHSVFFSKLAELGAVGVLAFLLFVGGLVLAVRSRWAEAPSAARWWASALLAAAAVGLGQATVDWIWLVPGVVGVCFLLAGLALAALRPESAAPAARSPAWLRVAATAGAAALAVLTVALYAGDVFVRKARATDPARAAERLDAAKSAARLLPWSTPPLLLQAGAHESLGRIAAARTALDEAARLEPDNFVVHALRGDLELRAGNARRARAHYRTALALNPRDVGLRELSEGRPGS